MKRKMKQIFGLLLSLTMALGMLPMMPTKALAAETITTLTLTGVTKPVAGEYPSIDGVSLGEQMEFQEETCWLIWNGTRYTDEFDDTKPFEEGKKYALRIRCTSSRWLRIVTRFEGNF